MAVLAACPTKVITSVTVCCLQAPRLLTVVKFLCDGMSRYSSYSYLDSKGHYRCAHHRKGGSRASRCIQQEYNRSFVAPGPTCINENTDLVIKAGSNMSSQVKITSNGEDLAEGCGLHAADYYYFGVTAMTLVLSRIPAYVQVYKVITIRPDSSTGSSS